MSNYDECCRVSSFKTIISTIVSLLSIAVFVLILLSGPAELTGIQAQLTEAGGTILANESNVVFDSVLNDQSSDIDYDGVTGEFTITAPGNYYVDWWVGTDGAGPSTTVGFAIEVNGVLYSESASPIVSGLLSGEALVTVTAVPTIVTLVNVTGEDVFVPVTSVQANIVITQVAD